MAASPSYRAPRAAEVLSPPPFIPPTGPRLHSDERRRLDAVLAAPHDDSPRLAFAEWCESHGDARGRFIRAQLAGEETIPDPMWAGVFEPWSARDHVWRRGFVESLSLAGRAFIALGEPLFRMTPLLEVRLVAVQPFVAELAACPWLAKLEALDLRGNHLGDAGLKILAPALGRLLRVNLLKNSLTEQSRPIVQSLRARGIEVLTDGSASRLAA